MKTIDARGLSCPEPVVLLRTAMVSGEDSYQPPARTPPATPSTWAIRSTPPKTAVSGR